MPWTHDAHRQSAEEAIGRGLMEGDLKVLAEVPEPAQSAEHQARKMAMSILDRLPRFNVLDYGAVGDGSTDDKAAIELAVTAAEAASPVGTVLFPSLSFYVASSVTIADCNVEAVPGAEITTDQEITALIVGSLGTTAADRTQRRRMVLPEIRQSSQVWAASGSSAPMTGTLGSDIGLLIRNVSTCELTIPLITDFSYGVSFGPQYENAYNTYHVGHMDNCAIGLRLKPATTGWVNQNTFIAGRCSTNSTKYMPVTNTRGILVTGVDGGISAPNGNTFVGTSFEGNGFEFNIRTEYASQNLFLNVRLEGTAAIDFNELSATSRSRRNLVHLGYGRPHVHTVTESANSQYNAVGNNTALLAQEATGSAGMPMFGASNAFSASSPIWAAYPAAVNPAVSGNEDKWTTKIAAGMIAGKRTGDDELTSRFRIDAYDGVFYLTDALVSIRVGVGTPEGWVTAPVGSLFLRSDGGANTTLYIKETGTGKTGWVAK